MKDRIGSQILTHYPENIKTARKITEQEANLDERQSESIHVPGLAKDLLEQIGFEARKSEFVDYKSGVSARMSITAFENLLSTAERRALKSGTEKTTVRLSDFMGIIPAVTGKVELVYEGEQEGAAKVAEQLLGDSLKTLFAEYFPKIEKLERPNERSPYQDLMDWFMENELELMDEDSDKDYRYQLDTITPLKNLIQKYQPDVPKEDVYFLAEFVLWALSEYKKLGKNRFTEGYQFKDLLGSYIRKL